MAEPGKKSSEISKFEAISFVWDIFALIAIPTVLLALAGRWADAHWHTTPVCTTIGLLLSLVICGFLVIRRAKDMAERMK